MSDTLTEAQIEIVTSTRPAVVEHGVAITTRFYERLFEEHPDVEPMFTGDIAEQAKRLASAVLAYVDHLADPTPLLPAVRRIAARHVAAGVVPEQYEVVGSTLLASFADVLGELDESVVDAWAAAYGVLADLFIETEAAMVAEAS